MSQPAITAHNADADALQRVIDIVTVALRNNSFTSNVEVDREPRTSAVRPTKNDAGIISLVIDGEIAVTIGMNVVAP